MMPLQNIRKFIWVCCLSALATTTLAQTVSIVSDGVKFPSFGGNKVVLAGNGAANHTGIGLQGGILQFYVPDASANIIFRRLSGSTYYNTDSTIMRITGAGNVGINTDNPGARLDVVGNMVVRSANSETAGMWMGNSTQTANNFFLGVRDETSFGFFYNAAAVPDWKLWVHTNTGAVGINSGVGQPGAMLVSAGSTGATNWQAQNDLVFYNLSNELQESNSYSITDAAPIVQPSGLSLTQSYPSNTRCIISFNVQATSNSCFACSASDLQINVLVDGSVQKAFRHYVDNGSTNTLTGTAYAHLAPGNHTIALQIQKLSGPTVSLTAVANRKSSLLVVAVPQN